LAVTHHSFPNVLSVGVGWARPRRCGGLLLAAAAVAATRTATAAAIAAQARPETLPQAGAAFAAIGRRAFAGNFTATLDTHFFRNADLHALANRRRHAFGYLVRHLDVNRVRNHLAGRIRNLLADRVALHPAGRVRDFLHALLLYHRASGAGHALLHGDRDHAADGVRHLLDAFLAHRVADRVGNLLDAVLFHRPAGGVAVLGAYVGAFLELEAGAFAIMADAGAIYIRAADTADHRVRNLLLADFRHITANRIWHLLDAGFLYHARDVALHLLDYRVRHFLANRIRHLFHDAFLDVGRAGDLLANGLFMTDLAAADLSGSLADDFPASRGFVAGFAGAGVEAAFTGDFFPGHALLAGHAVLLGHPLAALAGYGLASGHRLADGPGAVLVARLADSLVARAANFLFDALGHRLASRAADFAIAGLLHRLAHGITAFTDVLLADLLLDLVAVLLTVLLVDRLANGIAAFFPASLGDLFADCVVALLVASFVHRFAAGLADFLHDRLVARLAHGVMALFPAGFVDRFAAGLLNGLVASLVTGLVASLALLPVASLANGFHDRFLDILVAGVPPFFQDGVIHELVTRATLLLAGGKAALGVATRLRTAVILRCAAVACDGRLDRPEQADHCSQQRRSQAHPHDFASSAEKVKGRRKGVSKTESRSLALFFLVFFPFLFP
jgi:hypothetical protein